MLREQIQTWIEHNGSYRDGYYLLEKIGTDEAVLRSLRSGLEATYIKKSQKDRLRGELERLLASLPADVPVISAAAEPQAIKDLRDEARTLHKEHAYLKARLIAAGSNEERYDLADRIMSEIIPTLDDIYDQVREWERTGRVRGESRREIVSQVVQKLNRRGSIRSALSRLKKQLAGNIPAEERQEAEKRQAELAAELHEIEQYLDLAD